MSTRVYMQLALWVAILVWSASVAQAQCVTYQPWSGLAWPAPAYAPGVAQRSCFKVLPGACVELDTDVHVDSLWVQGTLRFADGADRVLNTHKIILDGVMEVGTATNRFTSNASLELTDLIVGEVPCVDAYTVDAAGVVAGPTAPETGFHPVDVDIENRTFLVRGAATLDMHGTRRASTWKFLAAKAYPADATSYATVWHGDDWAAGDTIVLASTDYDRSQAEARTITTVSPVPLLSGFHRLQIPALNHTHWSGRAGAAIVPWVFENAEVGLLSHNIKMYSPDRVATNSPTSIETCTIPADLDYTGAEMRIIREAGIAPTVRLEHVEVFNAGKAGAMGHYPVHFHELGLVPGSYVKGISVHTSGNRAIVVHGTQRLLLEDNVVYNVAGHAYYLEPMHEDAEHPEALRYDTIHNTLRHNLGVSIQCNPLDVALLGNDNTTQVTNSSVFYFADPRNVFLANAAAGAAHAGFYWAQQNALRDTTGTPLNSFYLCGAGTIDYAATDDALLDLNAFDWTAAPYTAADYARFADPVRCHGTFAFNIAHSSPTGFWAEEHKETLVRLDHFLAYKHLHRGVNMKNQGFTELVGLMAADNATAIWPASHAYHLWNAPQFLVVDAHVVGLSQNAGTTVLDKLYGVEVYEGHLHVAKTHFERFQSGFATTAVAAFGRHQSFPFYSNNPDNSVQQVTFGSATNILLFDDPDANASGEATVMLYDLDGSLVGAGHWIVPNDAFMTPLAGATWDGTWNAYTVDTTQSYGQILVHWCDRSPDLNCQHHDQRSLYWRQTGNGPRTYGIVMGLAIRDLTECSGACITDVLEAAHSNDGEHNMLGGNALAGHDYEVTYVDAAGAPLSSADLAPLTAMEIHWRYAPVGTFVTVNVPVPSEPHTVTLVRGERTVSEVPLLGAPLPAGPPASALEWSYDAVTSRVWLRLDARTDPSIDRANAAVLLLF